MKELERHIKNRKFERVYLFFGQEAFLLDAWQKALVGAVLPEETKEMNMDVFEGKVSVAGIIEIAETMPFFADYRLIIVKDSGLFAAGRSEEAAVLSDFAKNIAETTVLVFSEKDVDKRGRLYKRISETGLVLEAAPPKEAALADWGVKYAAKFGKKMAKSAAIWMIRTTSGDMLLLSKEIEKLAAYKGDDTEITTEDVDKLCAKSLEAKIFDLMKGIGNRDAKKACELFGRLMAMKESPLMVLVMIARQFRFCLLCSSLTSTMSQKDMAAKLSLHPFAVREFVETSRNFSQKAMVYALKECLETDFAIKNGQMEDVAALEILIVRCCNLGLPNIP